MTGLYALSVHQPYAAGIVHLAKSPENRGWPVPRQHVGTTIAIHSTKAPEFPALWPGGALSWADLFADDDERVAWQAARLGRKPETLAHWPRKLALGAVVGVATITGCHLNDPDELCGYDGDWEALGGLCSRWAQPDSYHWALSQARPLATPVPCRGHQKLWPLPDDMESAVRAQLARNPGTSHG